jgi:hypothetical protein
MPIVDQRRIAFDVGALKDILDYSPQAARSVGLPGNDPTGIVIDGAAQEVKFTFGDRVVSLAAEKLAALLISYCIRAGIRIPRQKQRSVRFNQGTIMLVFLTEYLAAPFPAFRRSKQLQPPSGVPWNGT